MKSIVCTPCLPSKGKLFTPTSRGWTRKSRKSFTCKSLSAGDWPKRYVERNLLLSVFPTKTVSKVTISVIIFDLFSLSIQARMLDDQKLRDQKNKDLKEEREETKKCKALLEKAKSTYAKGDIYESLGALMELSEHLIRKYNL